MPDSGILSPRPVGTYNRKPCSILFIMDHIIRRLKAQGLRIPLSEILNINYYWNCYYPATEFPILDFCQIYA